MNVPVSRIQEQMAEVDIIPHERVEQSVEQIDDVPVPQEPTQNRTKGQMQRASRARLRVDEGFPVQVAAEIIAITGAHLGVSSDVQRGHTTWTSATRAVE